MECFDAVQISKILSPPRDASSRRHRSPRAAFGERRHRAVAAGVDPRPFHPLLVGEGGFTRPASLWIPTVLEKGGGKRTTVVPRPLSFIFFNTGCRSISLFIALAPSAPLGVLVHVVQVGRHDEVFGVNQAVLVGELLPASVVALVGDVALAPPRFELPEVQPGLIVL